MSMRAGRLRGVLKHCSDTHVSHLFFAIEMRREGRCSQMMIRAMPTNMVEVVCSPTGLAPSLSLPEESNDIRVDDIDSKTWHVVGSGENGHIPNTTHDFCPTLGPSFASKTTPSAPTSPLALPSVRPSVLASMLLSSGSAAKMVRLA